jgi:hypothetical protein
MLLAIFVWKMKFTKQIIEKGASLSLRNIV